MIIAGLARFEAGLFTVLWLQFIVLVLILITLIVKRR